MSLEDLLPNLLPSSKEDAALARAIGRAAEPLPDLDDAAFGALFDRFADAPVVLLGEATHGTSEFYRARCAITRRLIERHGFSVVAVEADWPDASTFDHYVRHKAGRDGLTEQPAFSRFPTWMWRNREVQTFLGWLREHNGALAAEERAGFYGLDLYNLNASMRAVIDYLGEVDPEAARVARDRYGCLAPWRNEPQGYGRRAYAKGSAPCEAAVVEVCRKLAARALDYAAGDPDAYLTADGNARLVADAETYYRAMYYGAAESWNVRDRHMADTLQRVLDAKGPGAKAVVWAHNSHIGDARASDMGWDRGELNLGQLCRERWDGEVRLIGFGTHTGEVACADDWDEPMRVKRINPSRPGSYEALMHDSCASRFLLDLREGVHDDLRERLSEPRLERFIGVIYRPDTERWSHYAECDLPAQYDAWVWFDETSAVKPLHSAVEVHDGPDETWPFGL